MADVTISQDKLAQLEKAMALLNKLTADPKEGLKTQRKLKEIDPSLQFAALDIEETVAAPLQEKLTATEAALAKIQEEREAERKAAEDAKAEGALRDSIGRAKTKGKLSDEGVQNLIKFMQEKGVADAELALPAYLETLPPPPKAPASSPYQPMSANIFGTNVGEQADADAKLLVSEPWKFFDQKVGEVLSETNLAA